MKIKEQIKLVFAQDLSWFYWLQHCWLDTAVCTCSCMQYKLVIYEQIPPFTRSILFFFFSSEAYNLLTTSSVPGLKRAILASPSLNRTKKLFRIERGDAGKTLFSKLCIDSPLILLASLNSYCELARMPSQQNLWKSNLTFFLFFFFLSSLL